LTIDEYLRLQLVWQALHYCLDCCAMQGTQGNTPEASTASIKNKSQVGGSNPVGKHVDKGALVSKANLRLALHTVAKGQSIAKSSS
jgi:hypothetical protein